MASNVTTVAQRIEEKFGGKWKKAGGDILKPPPAVPTGSILLDEAIGECKGWPEGSIIEVYGPQHSGKTLLGYLAIAASQKQHPNRDHLIIDAENQFKFQARWAQQVGVDVANLYVTAVTSAEETFDKIEMAILGDVKLDKDDNVVEIVKPGNFGVILIDSVTQLVPLEMVHKQMEEKTRMAALASVMSHGLKKVVSAMSLAQSKTILIFVNQIRSNPNAGIFNNPEVRTGGNALPFYDTITLRVAKIKHSEERDVKGRIFAHQVKIKFEKNKAGQLPADPITFRLRYDGTGIDNDYELFNVGRINGLIEKFDKRGNIVRGKQKEEDGVKEDPKKGLYNFIKPGTDDLLEPSIKNFKIDDFAEILSNNLKIKEIILKFIKDGSFFSDNAIEEDNPDGEEVLTVKNEKEPKTEQSSIAPEASGTSPEPQETSSNNNPLTSVEVAPEAPVPTPEQPQEHKRRGRKKKIA